jgi:hypothetical protein
LALAAACASRTAASPVPQPCAEVERSSADAGVPTRDAGATVPIAPKDGAAPCSPETAGCQAVESKDYRAALSLTEVRPPSTSEPRRLVRITATLAASQPIQPNTVKFKTAPVPPGLTYVEAGPSLRETGALVKPNGELTLPVEAWVTSPGSYTISGLLSFMTCPGEQCVFYHSQLSIDVNVK